MVFPVMTVRVMVGLTGGGIGEAATVIAAGLGGPSTAPQSLPGIVLSVIETFVTVSCGALEWTTRGMMPPLTVLPVTWTVPTLVPGSSAATTMLPTTGPWGPNTPGLPVTWLSSTVSEASPAPGT